MKVLIACEFSGIVREAFRKRGHDAWSCDLLPSETAGPHLQGDVISHLGDGWDLMIGHPPCTYISFAGTAWWNQKGRVFKRLEALQFFAQLWEAPIEKICLENPKSCASPVIAKYSQEVQPFYFGDPEFKTTWLWLKNLPPLKHVADDGLFSQKTHTEIPEPKAYDKSGKARHWTDYQGSSDDRASLRAKTFPGIANAMAEQWGKL